MMLKKVKQVSFLVVIIVTIFLSGCSQEKDGNVVTAVSTQPTIQTATATIPTTAPTQTMQITMSPTPTASSTPTATATAAPTSTPSPLPDIPNTLEGLETWLSEQWQQQTDPELVQFSLTQAGGWMSQYLPHISHVPRDVGNVESYMFLVSDLDGNGTEEWIISLIICQSESKPWAPECQYDLLGNLWIINEDGLVYQAYQELNEDSHPPISIVLADFTGDNHDDLITFAEFGGIATTYRYYRIISGHFGGIENIIQSLHPQKTAHMMGASIYVRDETNDGISDLILHGGAYSSAGAGPQRRGSEIWSWNGNNVTLYERRDDPIYYFVHALYYANDAFSDYDFTMADSWYQRILYDQTLHSYSGEREYIISQQFAAFRLVLLYLHRRDGINDAQRWQSWLADNYPEQSLTQASSLLISEWELHEDLYLACETVTAFLQEEEAKLHENSETSEACSYTDTTTLCGPVYPLNSIDTYGVNPVLTVDDVCVVPTRP